MTSGVQTSRNFQYGPEGRVPIRTGPWRTNTKKGSELLSGVFAVKQYDKCLAKCMPSTAFVGLYQSTAER